MFGHGLFSGVFRTHALFSDDIRTLSTFGRYSDSSAMEWRCRENACDVGFCPKSTVSGPPGNAVAAIATMRYTCFRPAVS